MLILKNSPASEKTAAEYIKNGKVVIIPTDTIYGFSARVPDCADAVRKIKGREENKPFIELIAFPGDYQKYSDDRIPSVLLDLWPAPLTLIVRRKEVLGGGTVALRCPADEWLRKVIEYSESAVYSTSVNRSGCPALWKINDIMEEFEKDVPLIVSDGDKKGGVPSTIVNITGGAAKLVRAGAVDVSFAL
ncbi:MAG: L-threonylcarbamoyladenylate synthase [Spirochaetaceae bacterium]|nr:L-threonylcarbamoyladenylate synthase [Spirochaetaceae bacterium]